MKTQSHKIESLRGTAIVAGDKSISHRSLMFGAIARGTTHITDMLESEDTIATKEALIACGAHITKRDDGVWVVESQGLQALGEPAQVLDMGNSGTSTRLLAGLLSGLYAPIFMTGDASLRKRPMGRVIDPLSQMGVEFFSRSNKRLPMGFMGKNPLQPIEYSMKVASAQVKSAILLAGLSAKGKTSVIEHEITRDHTERMLAHFGCEPEIIVQGKQRTISVTHEMRLTARDIKVPADISSAAFPMVAGLITRDSYITMPNVGINTTRDGILESLLEMGANIQVNRENNLGEPTAQLVVKSSELRAVHIPAERAPKMIDEYPIMAVAAAFARGTSRFDGIGELRVKESDRLLAVVNGLTTAGVTTRYGDDWLEIDGMNGKVKGGGYVETHLDHRIAMSFLIMGMASQNPMAIDDNEPINSSFPNFLGMMKDLGADIQFL